LSRGTLYFEERRPGGLGVIRSKVRAGRANGEESATSNAALTTSGMPAQSKDIQPEDDVRKIGAEK
jgi:hypothetical protein